MSNQHSYCFIINCASNANRAEAFFRSKEKFLTGKFLNTEFIYISEGDSIVDIVKEKAQEYSHIIACGGDGTVNRVANGLVGSECILGVIPLGSGNDFAQSIGLGKDFEKNVNTLLKGKVVRTDLVKSNWGFFLNTFGIGVDGLTNYYASKSRFKSGFMRYFLGGLTALLTSKPVRTKISIPDQNIEVELSVWMVAVANGKSEGGRYIISPSSVNHDGKVELILVRAVSRLRLIIEFLKLSFGFSFKKNVIIEFSMTSAAKIKTYKKLKSHADGEQVSESADFFFEVYKGELPVIIA
ncbi:diacylglycerol kinase family protein [Gracilimonas sp.]|uniref:diacylglycerol/lipid kinase family protein n=1 Tax=Gracilimonas sp. TaxID=1974203 RepID=UPI0032EDFEE4